MTSDTAPVCVVTGVGPANGRALVREFARQGYRVAMLSRSAERLAELEAETPSAGDTIVFQRPPMERPTWALQIRWLGYFVGAGGVLKAARAAAASRRKPG
jgi:NAD(P)-dependent dehydrogenase (short-subunit alcohol dehydrogenase family)